MYQKTILLGYLGSDPEMRYMPDGTAVTNFSVATSRKWKDGQGNPVEETVWWRCSAWGKSGETINEFFEKGKPILVEGRVKPEPGTGGPRIFTRQDGTVGATYELIVERWSFAPGSGEGESSGSGARAHGKSEPVEEDEIPF